MTQINEQQAFDEWAPPAYRKMIWTKQAEDAARAGFAAGWYRRGGGKLAVAPQIQEVKS